MAKSKIVAELHGGQFILPSKLTMAQLFHDHWLPHKALSLSAKTIERYAEIVDSKLSPKLGTILVSRLHSAIVQKVYDE